ncbi:MAG: aminotransferase [Euryarchaeota archaeon]|nr:aminotransferase [Euryarchaeota archaeon]|tara:strand:+ start:3091 stop:4257 length:1167 start_codon:yes stop_codon:yes gene_type:complete
MSKKTINLIVSKIRFVIGKGSHQLHEPLFLGNEKKYVRDTIEKNFVSSAGKYVDKFEHKFKDYVKSKYAVAVVNGTQALFISLKVCGVSRNDEVLMPALTFVGTANAVSYLGAKPHFIDSDISTLGVNCLKLDNYLKKITKIKNGKCINKITGNKIKAIIPVHVFGHPSDIENILLIAKKYKLKVIEDAAEALGSYYKKKHLGTFGEIGCFSFNGNKIITTGGGGMVVSNKKNLAKKIKHLTTTAKLKHRWEYIHDEVGFNFRMPNINAALGLAQMEKINIFLKAKRALFRKYQSVFKNIKEISIFKEPPNSKSNYWLQTIILTPKFKKNKDLLIKRLHGKKIFSRPVWKLLSELKPYKKCSRMNLSGSKEIYERSINIPSSQYLELK